MTIPVEAQIHLNRFKPRQYQLALFDAIENKGYRRALLVWPRRAGKDMAAFNLCIRAALRRPKVIYYIFPTYSQGRKILFDSITNTGERVLDYIPKQLIESINTQEMKIRFINGSVLQIVGSDNYDCFDDQTEILSENGWKLLKDLGAHEKVATLREGYLEYNLPLKQHNYDFDGQLYAVKNSSMDFAVTPNHRMYVRSSKGFYKFKPISDPTIKGDCIPSQSNWIGEDNDLFLGYKTDEFMALLGLFLSEGSTFSNEKCYRVTLSQTKENIRREIRTLLNQMNINYCETKSGFNIENRFLYGYFSQFGLQPDRYIPKNVKSLAKTYLHILFEWLILGDGHRCDTYIAYYSTSKRLVDDVQEIIIKLGLSGNVREKIQKVSTIRGRTIKAKHSLYEVRVRKSRFKRLHGASGKPYIHTVPYKGKVYCVTVPSGVIKVRRNGFEMWSGNSLMGTNPQLCVFSEYALQDPRAYQFIRPILSANDGIAIFLSTPRGKNSLWELYNIAKNSSEWFCQKLTVDDTQHIDQEEIDKDRREGIMSEDLIQQEYYTSFEMGVEGSYYIKYLDKMRVKGQIGVVPYEHGFKVHTALDIGVRDSTCIIFYQVIGQTVRIIDCYDKTKEGLEHYVSVLQGKPYTYGRHFAPHDIKVREFGSGMTRLEKARQLGVRFDIAPDLSIMDGIEAVRSAFSKIWIDEKNCAPLIKSLENYRQEYDAKKKVYKSHPLHDIHSHYADAMRYLCISLPRTQDALSAQQLDKNYREAMYGDQELPAMFRDIKRY